jgi:integrase
MDDEAEGLPRHTRSPWSTKKKDRAPKGVYRHPNGQWAIRFTCGAGHVHKLKIGTLKSVAEREHQERRLRVQREPGWCPTVEARLQQKRVRQEEAREKARITFSDYAKDYLEWSRKHKRSWTTDRGMFTRLLPVFGDKKLDEVTAADVERFRDSLLKYVSRATANRYRDLLSGMFRRAVRLGLVPSNPVKEVQKFKEPGGRVVYLTPEYEAAILAVLPGKLRPLFTVSVNTGLRWSEQIALRWRDVDLLAGRFTVTRSKNGHSRSVPMNSVVRSALVDVGAARERPDDPGEPVFKCSYTAADKFFPRAVEKAQAALKAAGKDASGLEDYTWHGNRHTFASRLLMAGVDLRTVQELGGWRSLMMVQRYGHLAPDHLQQAVERLVVPSTGQLARN